MKRFKDFFAFVGFTGVTTLLLLLLMEVGSRLFLSTPSHFENIGLKNFSYAYHPWSSVRNTPGFRYKDTLRINKMGWRGPEWKREKPAGVKRVLLLGDSTAFSSFYIHEKATIAGYLERYLNKATKQKWQVLNMAVSGGFSRMSLAALAHDGTTLSPDAVFVLNGRNDSGAALTQQVGIPEYDILAGSASLLYGDMWDPRTGRSPRPFRLMGVLLQESHFFRWLTQFGWSVEFRSLAYAWIPSGDVDLSDYAGETIYVGFKFVGDSNSNTTGFRVDNVVIE